MDYGHSTGHGVGYYLCVHEGPQRISKYSNINLVPGMIVSNGFKFFKKYQLNFVNFTAK